MVEINMKVVSMTLLIVFTSAQVICMKYARSQPEKYNSATAVMMGEVMKMIFSFILICIEKKSLKNGCYTIIKNIQTDQTQILKMGIPALLYTIQNNFMYTAVSNLDAAIFQVCSQLKLLTAAIFSVTFLHKSLSSIQWLSLAILAAGICLLQWKESDSSSVQDGANFLLGMISIVVCSLTSGFAGVYTERMFKDNKLSIWVKNFWMAFWSLLIGVIMLLIQDASILKFENFFKGYSIYSWSAIFLLAIGGLIIAMVLKYADNILKAFGNSASIILSSLLSVYLFNFNITTIFVLGCFMVICATILYNYGASQTKKYQSLPQEVSEMPKA